MDTPITITGPAGPIEALLTPAEKNLKQACAVICHPHPLHQGSMHNKVVHTLSRAYQRQGIHALRFNYRGVGKSAGSYGDYVGEIADCHSAITWLQQKYPGHKLYLAGFSFGSYIAASQAAIRNDVEHLITVAPAVHHKDYQEIQNNISCPWLTFMGLDDEIVPSDEVLSWHKNLEQNAKLITFADTGHFFHSKLLILREQIENNI